MKKFFDVNVEKYAPGKTFSVYRPASLNNPRDHAVMFIGEQYMNQLNALYCCDKCLVFWPESRAIPSEMQERHAVIESIKPRKDYCRFFHENSITNNPPAEEICVINGAYIAKTAKIGKDCVIFPGAYIGGEVTIENNCYIGSGAKLMGEVHVGNNVVIRENAVIGADGLSTDRDENGHALTMPQFGGVIIEDDVQIGALTVIARGAIDNTILHRGVKVDNCAFVSHNVCLGEDTFVVGESILFGSSSTGKQVLVSGNSTIRDGRHIGDRAVVGMGSVVVKNVDSGSIVKGNPAK